MASLVRDTAFGQIVRYVTKEKYFRYREEVPGFQIPWQLDETGQPLPIEVAQDSGSGQPPESEKELELLDRGHGVGHQTLQNDETDARSKEHLSTIPTAQATESEWEMAGDQSQRDISRERPATWDDDVEGQAVASRSQSNVITPKRSADGIILVDWYTTDDQENPQNWSNAYKACVSSLIVAYSFVVYMGSSIYITAEPQVMAKFGIGESKAALGLSMYVLGYGFGPLLWSPLTEIPVFGRNIPYIVTYALFVIFGVPTALSNSLATLLVLRFLTGFLGSPCLATAPATFGDMYSFIQLPYALTAWLAACFGGPALGPLVSGFAVSDGHWRWALWEIVLMSGPVFAMMFFLLPETSASNILLKRARRLRKLTGNQNLRSQSEIDQGNATFRSVAMMALVKPFEISIKDPAVLFTHVYASFTYGIYYSFFEAFPIAYINIYGFSIGLMGVAFTSIMVGCLIAVAIYVAYQHFYLIPDITQRGPRQQEHRLVPAIFASMLIPATMFWFGWTAEKGTHYLVSLTAIAFWCAGSFILFQCVFMYLAMSYPPYAASLFAANDACRSALAGGAVIFGRPLYLNLGLGRGSSLLGGVQVGGVVGVILLWYYGGWLRSRSKFALS